MAATGKENLSDIEADDTQPLLIHDQDSHQHTQQRCGCRQFSYRLVNISQNGAVFMILLNVFFWMAFFSCVRSDSDKLILQTYEFHLLLFKIPANLVLLLCPIIGLLSDCYFGRYKVLQASMYSLLVAIVMLAISAITTEPSINYVIILSAAVSAAFYVSCIIPFTIDQLVGASGEQLSFTIYWLLWSGIVCRLTINVLICYMLLYLGYKYELHQALYFGLASLSFIIVFTMIHCCSHVLMTKPQISNPIKLVAQVLNYARKHKFPERRSAFTYWEDECPSRIDLGKDKYGGPFTVEEVEDVKTILKLIPLITCITPVIALGIENTMEVHTIVCDIADVRAWISFLLYLMVIFCLPVYQFLIYPILYNQLPSMLWRIGCGMFLVVFSHLFNSGVEIYLKEQSHTSGTNTTFTYFADESDGLSVSSWLMLASSLINIVGCTIAATTSLEFAMAQAPCQVRGLVSSVVLGSGGISFLLTIAIYYSIHDKEIAYIGVSVVMIVIFILFVFVSKWYKLRKRNDVIPYHMFAENQFESDYRQEREHLRNYHDTLNDEESNSEDEPKQ